MSNLKYKLVKTGILPCFYDALAWDGDHIPIYRIKALRDIPEHNISKGDLGGYVSTKMNLSQEGSCWIGGDAKALGNVSISEDAFVGDAALVISSQHDHFIEVSGNVVIKHSAIVAFNKNVLGASEFEDSVITGNVQISGSSQVTNVGFIEGDINIRDFVSINGARQITGEVNISGHAEIENNVIIAGKTFISDNVIVEYGATVVDSTLLNKAQVYAEQTVDGKILGGYPEFIVAAEKRFKQGLMPETSDYAVENNKDLLFSIESELRLLIDPVRNQMDFATIIGFLNDIAKTNGSKAKIHHYTSSKAVVNKAVNVVKPLINAETADALNLLTEIKNELHEYESDIVKILQYPAMMDKTDPFTLDMVAALKLSNRLALNPSHKGFVGSVFDLEKKFLAAESNAHRIASTRLTEGEKKNTDRAWDLIAIAANDASTEHEKKVAFRQAFKQLEGIIAVPDVAVDTFRVKIGLKELETLR